MKRTVPLLIAAICGTILIVTAFIPATVTWGETATVWFDVLAAIAFVLGGGNLLKVHLQKVSDQRPGWAYSLITVVTFLMTLMFGLLKWDVAPAPDQEFFGQSFVALDVDALPIELETSVDVDLDPALLEEEVPASVRRQFRWFLSNESGEQKVIALIFRGWMTGDQRSDLMEMHQQLNWKCAIERLSEQAVAPAVVRGRVNYYADHQALSATGRLSNEQVQALQQISSSPEWSTAVERLREKSQREFTTTLDHLPAGFVLPPEVAGDLRLAGTELTVTGPLTAAQKVVLLDQFEKVRPMNAEQIAAFEAELSALPGGLTDSQLNLLRGLLESSWSAEQLIDVLNGAGQRPSRRKSYCELFAEWQARNRQLVESVPSDEPDVTLNDAQLAALRTAVTDETTPLSEAGELLATLGLWLPAQEAALQQFLARLPTIGQRNRQLAVALTTGTEELSIEQFEYLLADFRGEHFWREEIHALQIATHQVKYPWSGDYARDGSPFWWTYEYAFKPLTATMFALLAFYVASAAFRAFRAKNLEALLLLGTAFIILLGRTPFGVSLTAGLPDSLAGLRIENVTMFIMTVINTAGNRAIMIGIALGIVSTSLKILLGVDRSYLGTGE